MNRVRVIFLTMLIAWLIPAVVFAMSSTNYTINWDSTNGGGTDTSTSTNYSLRDSVGGISGTSTSANYQLSAGYRAPEGDAVLSFIVKSQENATETTYSAFEPGTGLTGAHVVSVASTSSLSVGDYIAVVENKGYSQKVAVGKVTLISGGDVVVDRFDGATSTMSASPAGGNDYVYRLGGSVVSFGTISASAANTAVAMSSVFSSVPSGYTVYVHSNQVLQNASAQTIATVSDGVVTAGSEEYGASVTGTRAYLPDTDIGVTTTNRVIQTSTTSTLAIPDRVPMTYKLSITGSTNAGSYSQSVYYTLTVNY
ncbi:hypothetical protein FJZ48_01355 [Candidatus Uhrbacteria bacterium]|nr:hypothetical protein [Candidatus Uhrbacteria bacterium]